MDVACPRPVEYLFGNDRPGEQPRQLEAQQGDNRQQGVAQGMFEDHRALLQPLGAGGTDKIHFHHVEHTGAHIERQAARLQHHQRQHRQRQMGSHLQHILPAALVAAGIGHPAYRQPVEIDGEPFNQQQAEEKGGERHGGKHRDAHQMIKPGARAQGRNHAHRQADAPVKDQRDAGQQKRVPDVLVEQLADRDLILQRKA